MSVCQKGGRQCCYSIILYKFINGNFISTIYSEPGLESINFDSFQCKSLYKCAEVQTLRRDQKAL